MALPRPTMAAAVIASSPYDQNDLYQLSYNPYFWYGNQLQMYPAAPYSTMPSGTYPLRMQYSVDNQIANAEDQGNTLGRDLPGQHDFRLRQHRELPASRSGPTTTGP